jgi:hypothetical protein
VRYRVLERGEGAALKTAAPGADFSSICSAVADELEPGASVSDLPTFINQTLTRWLGDGILINA